MSIMALVGWFGREIASNSRAARVNALALPSWAFERLAQFAHPALIWMHGRTV